MARICCGNVQSELEKERAACAKLLDQLKVAAKAVEAEEQSETLNKKTLPKLVRAGTARSARGPLLSCMLCMLRHIAASEPQRCQRQGCESVQEIQSKFASGP